MQGRYNVLFLYTENSAQSIMAEAILNRKGKPTFTAYSADSHLTGLVSPEAPRQLGAPKMNFVFTVCDNAAKEVCPIWPGRPMTAPPGVPDPAAVEGIPDLIARAFQDAFMIVDRRISLLLCLSLASLPALAIQQEIDRIGWQ